MTFLHIALLHSFLPFSYSSFFILNFFCILILLKGISYMYHWPSSMRRLDNDLRLSHAVRICSFFSFFFILSNTRSEFSFSPNYSVFKQFLAVQYFLKWIETSAHLWQGMEKLLFNSHSRVVPFPEVHKVSLVRTRCGGEKAVLIIHSAPWTSICFWIGTLTWDQQPVICT